MKDLATGCLCAAHMPEPENAPSAGVRAAGQQRCRHRSASTQEVSDTETNVRVYLLVL